MESINTEFKNLKVTDKIQRKVGVAYDFKMNKHCPKYDHVENPSRLTSIISRLEKRCLLKECSVISSCETVSDESPKIIHSQKYIDYVKTCCADPFLIDQRWADTYFNSDTDMAARLAIDAINKCIDHVMTSKWDSAFAAIRPPGHHANIEDDKLNGFCIYNNVAIAAKYAQSKYGVKRVLIYDWDVHHGDSTQKQFFEDDSILFISLHKFNKGYFYPGKSGDEKNIGNKAGTLLCLGISIKCRPLLEITNIYLCWKDALFLRLKNSIQS